MSETKKGYEQRRLNVATKIAAARTARTVKESPFRAVKQHVQHEIEALERRIEYLKSGLDELEGLERYLTVGKIN